MEDAVRPSVDGQRSAHCYPCMCYSPTLNYILLLLQHRNAMGFLFEKELVLIIYDNLKYDPVLTLLNCKLFLKIVNMERHLLM